MNLISDRCTQALATSMVDCETHEIATMTGRQGSGSLTVGDCKLSRLVGRHPGQAPLHLAIEALAVSQIAAFITENEVEKLGKNRNNHRGAKHGST